MNPKTFIDVIKRRWIKAALLAGLVLTAFLAYESDRPPSVSQNVNWDKPAELTGRRFVLARVGGVSYSGQKVSLGFDANMAFRFKACGVNTISAAMIKDGSWEANPVFAKNNPAAPQMTGCQGPAEAEAAELFLTFISLGGQPRWDAEGLTLPGIKELYFRYDGEVK